MNVCVREKESIWVKIQVQLRQAAINSSIPLNKWAEARRDDMKRARYKFVIDSTWNNGIWCLAIRRPSRDQLDNMRHMNCSLRWQKWSNFDWILRIISCEDFNGSKKLIFYSRNRGPSTELIRSNLLRRSCVALPTFVHALIAKVCNTHTCQCVDSSLNSHQKIQFMWHTSKNVFVKFERTDTSPAFSNENNFQFHFE